MKTRKGEPDARLDAQHTPCLVRRELATRLINDGLVINDPDNHRAVWFGSVLTFSGAQMVCWEVLWHNFTRGNLPIPQGRVLAAWRGSSNQVADVFKRHPAWRTVIVGNGRGYLWLQVPSGYLQEIMAPPR